MYSRYSQRNRFPLSGHGARRVALDNSEPTFPDEIPNSSSESETEEDTPQPSSPADDAENRLPQQDQIPPQLSREFLENTKQNIPSLAGPGDSTVLPMLTIGSSGGKSSRSKTRSKASSRLSSSFLSKIEEGRSNDAADEHSDSEVSEADLHIPGAWVSFERRRTTSRQSTRTVVDSRSYGKVVQTRSVRENTKQIFQRTYNAPNVVAPKHNRRSSRLRQQQQQQKQPQVQQQTETQQTQQEQQKAFTYGFSYTDSSFASTVPSSSQQSEPPPKKIAINPNTPFQDILVYRPLANFSFHAPTSNIMLPCTGASPSDTMRMRRRAATMNHHDESKQTFSSIYERLERMVAKEVFPDDDANISTMDPQELVVAHTKKLRDWLENNVDERHKFGEPKPWLLHEIEWADWFVQAAELGVFHLKVEGCECSPKWEDDLGEWGWTGEARGL